MPSRRDLTDGSIALLLLTFAVTTGYTVLATPAHSRAKMPQRVASVVTSVPGSDGKPEGATPTPDAGPAAPGTTPSGDSAPIAAPPAPVVAPRAQWPARISGRVVDAEKAPLAGASVVAGGNEVPAAADGTFALDGVAPDATVVVKLPGYAKARPEPTKDALEIVLRPFAVKAAYLTYFGFNDRGIRTRVLGLVSRTELNAVVIDVKGDRGWILYRTGVPLALEIDARGPATIKDFESMMADLKARNVYTVARIVTFKDNILATRRPDLAILDTRTGKPWLDRENLAWVDPFREEVWAYNIALAKEAIAKGFDEVQFDYVRFPTDGKLQTARYLKPVNKETRLPTIAAFLERARREIGPTGAFVAADLFGYTAFNENDTDIGQRIEELAPHLDYVCPMLYPSGYHVGIPGYRNPVQAPYQVVHESVRLIRKRAGGWPVRVRPWLQDFRDYAFDKRIFGVPEIRAQIKGTDEAGGVGWMLWNPRNDYTGAALRPKGPLAAK
ncbi:MAG: carboxypeptidase regulatory-like domain-containing protein [Candidatus Rokubacteria bacterium]|nr:carboxypeptidase regulatory-like domain-containing protein [Candidatus Rokubacteria bacterium]